MSESLSAALARACTRALPQVGEGRVADYIPALARIDPKKFGAAVITVEGDEAVFGDADEPFSIQSLSKALTLTMALEKVGDTLWERVGREPSGTAFNSILQLELEAGIPRNPMINAGALVVTDTLLEGQSVDAAVAEILTALKLLSLDESIFVDAEVAESEAATGHRNRSLASFLKSCGNLANAVEDVLGVYFQQCAIAMSCRQLARSALFLAADGRDPLHDRRFVSPLRARRVNAVMLMCGHYDASGDFAFNVGLPAKSGVGGGIVAVAPGRAAMTVWSPCLNEYGNSHAGTRALAEIVRETGWSVF
jgi:glutaminase